MRKKNKSRRARSGAAANRDNAALPDMVCTAENEIDAAVAKIRAVDAKFTAGILHGAYGKQELVQACYGAFVDLERHRLSLIIHRRLAKLTDADTATDFVALLIGCASPDLTPAVVSNWAAAIHFARAHHIRPFKVRAFLYLKGGINACATLHRAGGGAGTERSLLEDDEDRLPRRRGPRKPVWKAPAGRRRLSDLA